jgi:thymidylate synthase (FAD)
MQEFKINQISTAKLVSVTQPLVNGIGTAEELIVYCARASNPGNQLNTATTQKLINYCIKNGHWSPFEMVSMTVEINTSRAIAAQILRHRSFSFQEFSQRYSTVNGLQELEWRLQGKTNRQVGDEIINIPDKIIDSVKEAQRKCIEAYSNLLKFGVAKECARMVLPLNTTTVMYMTGSVRSWIHYLDLRCQENTQKEHRQIAEKIKDIFINEFPFISEALELKCNECTNQSIERVILEDDLVHEAMIKLNSSNYSVNKIKRHSIDEYYFEIVGHSIEGLPISSAKIIGILKISNGNAFVSSCEIPEHK